MLFINNHDSLLAQMLPNLISLRKFSLPSSLIPNSYQLEYILFFHLFPDCHSRVHQFYRIDLLKGQLFCELVVVTFECVHAIDESFTLFVMQFEVVLLVITTYLEQKFFTFLA